MLYTEIYAVVAVFAQYFAETGKQELEPALLSVDIYGDAVQDLHRRAENEVTQ